MELKLYNTLTRKKEVFKPIKKGEVGVYGCGPTVYWYQHIGNLRRYLFEDILIRILKYNKYKINHIINITDVGHLTSDADEGEDKIEKAAKKEGKKAREITGYYFNVFEKDLEKLNILKPNLWPKATEHIKEQIEMIKILEKKGFIYETLDGIYFNTSKFKDYGKLAKLNIKGLQKGKRIDFKNKKNKTDFALWKFSEKPGVRQQEWNSPWGIGFPGWHIECSAMSMKYLGKHFDIHTGGIDHIPVHHTNEIAQSEAFLGKKPWVNYWLHSNHLILENGKMSKSSEDILTISELEKQGFKPLTFRYLCLLTNYRKKIIFNKKNLESAQIAYNRMKNIISEIKDTSTSTSNKTINKTYLKEFEKAINNNLDTPKALQVLWRLVRDKNAKGKLNTIEKIDKVFGLKLLEKSEIKIPIKIKELIKNRENARKIKDWKKADDLKDKINKLGYIIDDAKEGVRIKRI